MSKADDLVVVVEKYSLWVRATHWLNVVFLSIMIWSGLLIYWANPAYIPLPDSIADALGLSHKLAEGMGWHFAVMWLFALNGIIYVAHLLLSGEWKEIVPLKRSFRDAIVVVKHDAGLLRGPLPPQPGKINGAQRFAYTGALILGALVVITGIAIWKPVQLQFLTEGLGGYPAARFEHFACMTLLVIFILTHVAQVVRAGRENLRGMIAGYDEAEPLSTQQGEVAVATPGGDS